MIPRNVCIAIPLLLAPLAVKAATNPATEPERVEIIAYCTPPADTMSVELFREMGECGFTAGIPAEKSYDTETVAKMMHLAHQAGIRLFINSNATLGDPESVAARFKDHPGLAGYFIVDEPTWSRQGWNKKQYLDTPLYHLRLGDLVHKIQTVDPAHPAYINMFPNYANPEQLGTGTYAGYVDKLLEEVPDLKFLSFDHYPITGYKVRPEWYENMEIITAAVRRRGIPFWAFALTSTHFDFTPATLEQLRLQMHVNLAYGAQGLQYFPYWAPNKDHWFSPINHDGSRSVLYDHVKALNAHIQTMAGVFKNAKVLETAHTGWRPVWRPGEEDNAEPWEQREGAIPLSTRPYKASSPVRKFIAQGKEGALVSTISKNGKRHLVVVNKDYAHVMVLRITFDGSRKISRINADGSWSFVADKLGSILVPPGDIIIFRWEEGG